MQRESAGQELLELKTKRDVELADSRLGMADHLQLAFLMEAERQCGTRCDRGLVVYIDKTGGYASIACEADEKMVAAAAEWARQRDRLKVVLRLSGWDGSRSRPSPTITGHCGLMSAS